MKPFLRHCFVTKLNLIYISIIFWLTSLYVFRYALSILLQIKCTTISQTKTFIYCLFITYLFETFYSSKIFFEYSNMKLIPSLYKAFTALLLIEEGKTKLQNTTFRGGYGMIRLIIPKPLENFFSISASPGSGFIFFKCVFKKLWGVDHLNYS